MIQLSWNDEAQLEKLIHSYLCVDCSVQEVAKLLFVIKKRTGKAKYME